MKIEEKLNLKIIEKIGKNINLRSRKNKIKKNKLIFNIIIILFIFIFIFIITNFIVIKIDKLKKKIITLTSEKKILEMNITKSRPKIIAISYGSNYFQRQLFLNRKSALEVGKVDEYYSYGPKDIDHDFMEKNKEILSKRRGDGYWLWKPYFILKTFKEKLNNGDYLFYTDAGILYMNSTYQVIDFLKDQNSEMWFDRITLKEKEYSKRDVFILLGVDMPFYRETYQYMGGIQVYKKSKYTEKFLEELLYYSQDKRLITDNPNTQGQPNYPGFKDNRHDQSILSLLIKKYGIANSGRPNLSLDEIFKRKRILMPNIFCIYRKRPFKDYEDIKQKCAKILERSTIIFTN